MTSAARVIALAGRRIDAPDASPARFRLANADMVRGRILAKLVELRAEALVCSAACGADLLALDAARELELRRIVVLPSDAESFSERSVIDRPGGVERWLPLFKRVLRELPPADLLVLKGNKEGQEAFAATNEAIVERALELAKTSGAEVRVVVVWDGRRRQGDDLTMQFLETARRKGMPVDDVLTT